jgi:hypothetical protein
MYSFLGLKFLVDKTCTKADSSDVHRYYSSVAFPEEKLINLGTN